VLSKYFPELPSDSNYRTLLKTPKSSDVNIMNIEGGEYVKFNLTKELEIIVAGLESVTIDTNVDGVPISNSSIAQFYVITSHNIYIYRRIALSVCVFNFILHQNGVNSVNVKIGLFICDSITRAPLLFIKHPCGFIFMSLVWCPWQEIIVSA